MCNTYLNNSRKGGGGTGRIGGGTGATVEWSFWMLLKSLVLIPSGLFQEANGNPRATIKKITETILRKEQQRN